MTTTGPSFTEQMRIGVTLKVGGDAPQKVKSFHELIQKLTKATDVLNEKLKITGGVLKSLSDKMMQLNPRFAQFVDRANLATGSLRSLNTTAVDSGRAFGKLNAGLKSTEAAMSGLAAKTATLKKELDGLNDVNAGGGGRRKRRGGIHVHPLSFAGLGFSGPQMAVGAAGIATYKGFKTNVEYEKNLSQLTLQNIPGATHDAADQFIRSHTTPLVGPNKLAHVLTDTAVISKNFKEATAIAPTLARMQSLIEAQGGTFSNAEMQAAIKSAELLTGSMEAKELIPALETIYRIRTGSGNRVKATDFLTAIRGSRGEFVGSVKYGKHVDLNQLFALETFIQENGGPQTGRQVAMLMNRIRGGRMSTASALDMQKFGLIKPGGYEPNKIGMIKRVKPGGVLNSDDDFLTWIYNTWLPQMRAGGVTDFKDLRRHAMVQFTNTDLNLVTTAIAQQEKMEKMIAALQKAAGFDESEKQLAKTPGGSLVKLATSWERFELSLGKLTEGPAAGIINSTVTALDALSKLFESLNNFSQSIGEPKKAVAGLAKKILPQFLTDSIDAAINLATPTATTPHEAGMMENPDAKMSKAPTIKGDVILNGTKVGDFFGQYLNQHLYHSNIASNGNFNPLVSPTTASSSGLYGNA